MAGSVLPAHFSICYFINGFAFNFCQISYLYYYKVGGRFVIAYAY
jgi:hypothetical protein